MSEPFVCLFSTLQEDQKTVKMMYQKKKLPFGYIQDLKCRVLELPYRGKELSMIILLPDDIEDGSTGLKKVTAPSFMLRVSSSCIHLPCVVVASAWCVLRDGSFLSSALSFFCQVAHGCDYSKAQSFQLHFQLLSGNSCISVIFSPVPGKK